MPDIHDQVEGLMAKVGKALEELLTLRIETAITPMKVSGQGDLWSIEPNPGNAVEGITTIIRLEQGDIKNAMSEGALQNAKLMEIHSQQVAMSRQIVADNVKALVELARSLTT